MSFDRLVEYPEAIPILPKIMTVLSLQGVSYYSTGEQVQILPVPLYNYGAVVLYILARFSMSKSRLKSCQHHYVNCDEYDRKILWKL